jgi:hypothetical protein
MEIVFAVTWAGRNPINDGMKYEKAAESPKSAAQ